MTTRPQIEIQNALCECCDHILSFPFRLSCCGIRVCRECVRDVCHSCGHECDASIEKNVDIDAERACQQLRELLRWLEMQHPSKCAQQASDAARLLSLSDFQHGIDISPSNLQVPHRQDYNSKLLLPWCIICREAIYGSQLIRCYAGHEVCRECFAPYVRSLAQDVGKLKDSQFSIQCPQYQCKSCWSSSEVVTCLCDGNREDVLHEFVSALAAAAARGHVPELNTQPAPVATQTANASIEEDERLETELQRLLADKLNLRCPTRGCRHVLDPSPDGCCAMRCFHCGTYFCWLCFTPAADNNQCHGHVRQCARNPRRGEVFLDPATVDRAHRKLRIEHIITGLNLQFSDSWNTLPHVLRMMNSPAVTILLRDAHLSLDDLVNAKLNPIEQLAPEPPVPEQRPQEWNFNVNYELNATPTTLMVMAIAMASFYFGSHWLSNEEDRKAALTTQALMASTEHQELIRWEAARSLVILPLYCLLLKTAMASSVVPANWRRVELAVKVLVVAAHLSYIPGELLNTAWYALRAIRHSWFSMILLLVFTDFRVRGCAVFAMVNAAFEWMAHERLSSMSMWLLTLTITTVVLRLRRV